MLNPNTAMKIWISKILENFGQLFVLDIHVERIKNQIQWMFDHVSHINGFNFSWTTLSFWKDNISMKTDEVLRILKSLY